MKIKPLHEVRDFHKLDMLETSMSENGWCGLPVLALNCGDYLQALTGSHRIAAAERAGVEVSTHIIDQPPYTGNDDEAELFASLLTGGDESRLAAINELFALGLVDAMALHIMDREIGGTYDNENI